jgi:hypothetical protein
VRKLLNSIARRFATTVYTALEVLGLPRMPDEGGAPGGPDARAGHGERPDQPEGDGHAP